MKTRDTASEIDAPRPIFIATLVLMIAALSLGGSTVGAALQWVAIELLGLLVLLLGAWRLRRLNAGPYLIAGCAILLLTAAIPALQLVRLPPTWWRSLPGRAPLAQALPLETLSNAWRPISLTPDKTWDALLFLLGPGAMFVAASQLSARQRLVIAAAVLAVALASLLLGAVQVAGASSGVHNLYNNLYDGIPSGFFANRNHQASFLVCAVALTAVVPDMSFLPDGLRRSPLAILGLMVIFSVGAAATLSRAGLLLLGPVLVGAGALAASRMNVRRRALTFGVFFGLSLIAAVLVAVLRGATIWDRFLQGQVGDLRFDDLPQSVAIAKSFWPIGSGIGSFDAIFQAQETVRGLSNLILNHVHNDYVEVWIEAGLPAVALVTTFACWWLFGIARVRRRYTTVAPLCGVSGGLITIVLLLHSLVDYPLREPAAAVLFAFGCALLASEGQAKRSKAKMQHVPTPLRST